MTRLVLAALLSPPFSTLTYALPDACGEDMFLPGQRAIAPLGNSHRAVVVLGPAEKLPQGVSAKPLLWPLERKPLLEVRYIEMVRNLAARQMEPVGKILATLMPRKLKSARVRFRVSDVRFPRFLLLKHLKSMSQDDLSGLVEVWRQGQMEVLSALPEEREEFVRLRTDPPWPVRPGAKRQIEILDFLYDRGQTPRGKLLDILGASAAAALRTLAEKGVVEISAELAGGADEDEDAACCVEEKAPYLQLTPTPMQQLALDSLCEAFHAPAPRSMLLHGVTGSGKTLVYMRLVRECLESGRSAIVLAPEVALACALAATVRKEFPDRKVYFYHGYQSPTRREETFVGVAREKGPVLVVGTRSSLFLPVRNLGLVVMDEEHDESFKQEERLSYQAKEVAYFRTGQDNGLLVLGSATPDLKTFQASKSGALPVVTLPERVGASRLPQVSLVDMSAEEDPKNPLAKVTVDKLVETVESGGQAIIMLNRRGYAPIMYCLTCEEVVRCPDCQVALTYHKSRERMVCHYCGLSRPYPGVCSKCGEINYLPLGEGTEQLEERLVEILPPDTKILRLDRDSARRQERMEAILKDFSEGKAQVLVGTQMLSKGHHFPGVTLVAVADADVGLNLPDYRAAERTFQLLVQVSGRAGRGEKPGEVLIQTRSPQHRFWKHVLTADYAAFFEEEIELRRKFSYPPFTRLALIRFSHPVDWKEGPAVMSDISDAVRSLAPEQGVRVLGPVPAPLSQLKRRKRFHCMLKGENWPDIRNLFGQVRGRLGPKSKLRMELDLDPVSML